MEIDKIHLMAIILVFANCFLTVKAQDNPKALEDCYQYMNFYCRVQNPTSFDCAQAALLFWKIEDCPDDVKEYYDALYERLDISYVETPAEYCHKKKNINRQQCRAEMENYILKDGEGMRGHKKEKLNYAFYYAFFNAVFSCPCEGYGISATNWHQICNEGKHSYEDNYILLIYQHMAVKANTDSPVHFCRTKHDPTYEKPSGQFDNLNFNALNSIEENAAYYAFGQCLKALAYYCRVENPAPIDCAKAAIMFWTTPMPNYSIYMYDVQEYYDALYEKLDIKDVPTPSEYCHNKKQPPLRSECRRELRHYATNTNSLSKRDEIQTQAVRYAFYDTVFACSCKGDETFRTTSHRVSLHTHEDKYLLLVRDKIQVMDGIDTPIKFCTGKHMSGDKMED